MTTENGRLGAHLLGSHIDALDWNSAQTQILDWAHVRESRYVCVCNVHSLMTARREADFADVLSQADLATPDGMPLVWCLRRRGFPQQVRIDGPTLMMRLCESAAERGISVFLFGGAADMLTALQRRLLAQVPNLQVAGSLSPPFRPLSTDEQQRINAQINDSGAGIIFVALGCPKQETWMRAHRGVLRGVMIGVGAAFDFHAGTIRRAPHWMRRNGLEWLHRLMHEPRRLWRRYLVTNSLFIFHLAGERVAALSQRVTGKRG